MKFMFSMLAVIFSTSAFAINIRIFDIDTKEIKTYTTQDKFKIPVETKSQKCFLTKDSQSSWGYSCTSRLNNSPYVPSHKTLIDCNGVNNILATQLMDIKPDGKGGTIASPEFDILISCL